MIRLWVGCWLTVVVAACGGGEMTVSEYAEHAEDLVAEMEAAFVSLDESWLSQPPTVARAQEYWDRRLEIRADFLEGVRDLDPPDVIADQHETAIDVFSSITAADQALAGRVAKLETIAEHWEWNETPEGRAAEAALEEVYAFCRASQAEFDATAERESLEEVDWLPPQLKEVVKVAFGCPPQ